MEQDKPSLFNPQEMLSPFDAIKETDGEGREWWNSRKLARLLGYQKYWNFERLMDKMAPFLQKEKGLNINEHMVEIDEMAQLGSEIDKSGELHLSESIRKIRIPLDKWEEEAVLMYNINAVMAEGRARRHSQAVIEGIK